MRMLRRQKRHHRSGNPNGRAIVGTAQQSGCSAVIARDLRSGVEQLGDMIAEARTIVPFTGAGISTECGIPGFPLARRLVDP